ncbi:MAG TPA: amino acid--tRNA ligase-related protein, partial [Candidatus Dojkabacteria bacterium]|nr:amino acid--tRNA ligase-related protein [Candidatus Dojkabacteria bacterium]
FVTHMDALDQDFYLRISQELNLKRLIGGGYEKVYEIGPRFRNEGLSDEHLPEHIAMEFYWAYSNYKEGMQFIEELFKYVAEKTFGTLKFKLGEFNVDLSKEWEVIEYSEIIKDRFGVDVFNPDMEKIIEILKKNKVKLDGDVNVNRAIDNLWKLIRKTIEGPVFIVHEPKFLSPLAKSLPENPELTERFHPIIAGSEVGNGFSELNDPQDQLARFMEQQNLRDSGDVEAQMLDIDFVEMLEYGMAPTFGYGHSERVFWILEGVSAKEGVPFPPLKVEIDSDTKQIYPELFKKNTETKVVAAQDFSKRIVTVLNERVEDWQLLNTVGHLSAYLGNRVEKGKIISRDTFVTKDGIDIPANSQYPIVALSTNSKELLKLMQKVLKTDNIEYLVYTNEMVKYTDDKKLAKALSDVESSKLEILGIGIFGDNDTVKKLTGKFSLHK